MAVIVRKNDVRKDNTNNKRMFDPLDKVIISFHSIDHTLQVYTNAKMNQVYIKEINGYRSFNIILRSLQSHDLSSFMLGRYLNKLSNDLFIHVLSFLCPACQPEFFSLCFKHQFIKQPHSCDSRNAFIGAGYLIPSNFRIITDPLVAYVMSFSEFPPIFN